MDHGLAGAFLGFALFLFPGAAWSLALAPGLSLPGRVALTPVLAFTVMPAALFTLNLAFGVPIRLATVAFLAVALGMAGVAVASSRPLLARLEA